MAQPGGGGSVDHGREPCPDRILDDIGGAFGMGAVGGGIWHLIKGVKNSPSGARTRGGIEVKFARSEMSKTASGNLALATFSGTAACNGYDLTDTLTAGYQTGSSKNRRQLCCLGWIVFII